VFGLISHAEFNKLIKQTGISSYIIFTILFSFFSYYSYYFNSLDLSNSFFNEAIEILLVFSIFVLLFSIRDLFISKDLPEFLTRKYINSVFYISSSFIFIFLIGNYNNEFNPNLILGCFILVWVNDSLAFIIGKRIGKQKLFMTISPNKTVEGFLGGLFFCCICSIPIANYIGELNFTNWLIISIIISVFGTMGDLVESKYKRKSLVKDSGILLPGHGGLLDRLDSIIFASPFIYLFLKTFSNVS
jgi:phosphatidate cytidylyltransferase